MRIVLFTNIVSPHQIPLAHEIVRLLGEQSFRYVATLDGDLERNALGWASRVAAPWVLIRVRSEEEDEEIEGWLLNAE
jgi:hypothetical protein